MKFHSILAFFIGTALATSDKRVAGCSNDSCARAVTGTHLGASHPSIARVDCSSFFQKTITLPVVTVQVTDTVNTMTVIPARHSVPTLGIPYDARVCTEPGSYVSACSCLGVTPATITAVVSAAQASVGYNCRRKASTTTVTAEVTATVTLNNTSSTTSSSASPTCTNTLTDPLNCGACGNMCTSGVCERGSCSSTSCVAQKCGSFQHCNDDSNCYCFSSTRPLPDNGFCGANYLCDGATPCASDAGCVPGSSGNICAVNTCCSQPSDDKPGICLQAQCGNPATKLMMMARGRLGLTAAYKLGMI